MRIRIIDDYKHLKEMADGLADIKKHLRDCSDQVRQNLMQIFLWRNTPTVRHWESELYGVCHRVSLCRNTKKFPKKSVILQELWLYWEDCYYKHLRHYVDELQHKEQMTVPDFNVDNLYYFLEDYYEWSSELLSKEGWIDFSQVACKVDDLLDRYSLQ